MSTIKVTDIKAADGTSALTIADSSGNVGIGTSSTPTAKLEVISTTGIKTSRSGGAAISMVAGSSGEARIDTSILSRAFQVNSSGSISLKATSGSGDGAVDIDGSGNVTLAEKLIIDPTKGIQFRTSTGGSGTFGSGILDDYEEGTWDPVIQGANSGSFTGTGNSTYTKVGNQVTVWCEMVANNGTANFGTLSGTCSITGLPFIPAVDAAASIYYYDHTGTGTPYALILNGSATVGIRKFLATTANSIVDGGDIDGTNQIRFCISYQI